MHTPFTIKRAFRDGIVKFTEIKTVVEITGIYQDSGEKIYKHFYKNSLQEFLYDYVIDQDTKDKISILISEEKRFSLKNGRIYCFRCFADLRVESEATVKLLLFVEEVIDREASDFEYVSDPQKQETANIKSEMIRRFRSENLQKNVSLILKVKLQKHEKPKIALVQPLVNKTLNDIKGCLGQHYDKYIFEHFKVSFKSEQQIMKALKDLDSEGDFNLIGLFRGGGEEEDFEVFNSIGMGETVMQLRTPFVMAVGHADDEPFAQRVADRAFNTPADFGSYLNDTYVNSGREDDLSNLEKTLNDYREDLNAKRTELQIKEKALSERAANLERQFNFSKIENSEDETVQINLNLAKEQLHRAEEEKSILSQQIRKIQEKTESGGKKTRAVKYKIAAALLAGMAFGAGTYPLTKYLFDVPEAPKAIFTNSNSKLSPNVSNSKNK